MAFPSRRGLLLPAALIATLVGHALPLRGQGVERFAEAGENLRRTADDLYREGLRLRDQGRIDEALDVWEEAWDALDARGAADPRIGVAYLELATREDRERRFDTATRMFLWGLSGTHGPEGVEAIGAELERVLLIMDDDERDELERVRRSRPDSVARLLKRFWLRKDPTPATTTNERLIEHWQRIHEAQRRFVYNRSSPIGTDDRGITFLRFGEPARTRRGSLGASEFELTIRTVRDPQSKENLRRYDLNPQYEVWVYDQLNDEGFTYFLFGNVDGTGPFELVDGLHELIPPAARSRASARYTPGGIPASFYLELFYYQDLSAVGGHFGRRFAELDQLWNTYTERRRGFLTAGRVAPRETELEAINQRFEQEDRYFPPAPPQMPVLSEFEGRARDEVVAQVVRTLSDDDVPLLVIVAASSPRIAIADRREAYEQRIEVPGWVMQHTLIIRDEHLEEVGRLQNPVDPVRADLSTFVIRHVPRPLHLTLTAQTYREGEEEGGEDVVVASDRFPGQAHFEPAAPLSSDQDLFEMSDVLTGVPVPPEIDPSGLPYPLLPASRIWRRDPLRIYLELYHLGSESGSGPQVQAAFRIVPIDEEGEPVPDQDGITLEDVALSPERTTYRQFFDIALRDQEPGRYRLEVTVTDLNRNQTRTRSALIELVN